MSVTFDKSFEELVRHCVVENSLISYSALKNIWEDAYDQGFEDGEEDGHMEGWNTGYQEGLEEGEANT